jgi:hypothetical protein
MNTGITIEFFGCIESLPGAHPASYPMGTGGSFPGDIAAGA